ncbi:MAG: glycosyltransferase family 2 protein [Gammaproteobacteria bacterium]
MYSLIIPVYKNEGSIPLLLAAINDINQKLDGQLEAVFVVDGSPDQSYALLKNSLPQASFRSKLLLHSRNFGSYAAIRAGLEIAEGQYFAVMAADLQEPPELIVEFFQTLTSEAIDVAFGVRRSRKDPLLQKIPAKIFWFLYKKLVNTDMPPGGIDIFACNLQFRNQLLVLNELNSSLVGLAFWLGFRRKMVAYDRIEREHGKSAWSFKKRLKYATDSLFAFSDFPIKFLYLIGVAGIALSIVSAFSVILAKIYGIIPVPGYARTTITIVFFAALNSMGLGIIGSYVWRAFENTKLRPQSIVMSVLKFNLADKKT